MASQAVTCRFCEVSGYLREEAQMTWYSADEAASIRALAGMWQRKCACDRISVLLRLREILCRQGKHVR
jgi:hypothetical protein